MGTNDSRSPADIAFERFKEIRAKRRLYQSGSKPLSESDTRAKLIDPLFKEVLGWNESEIRREQAVAKGYVDYVLGADFSYLLVEAKRALPRFQLAAPSNARRLKLSGPHLLGNKKMRLPLEQAQGYANDLGVQFCIVTNGTQVIVFRPHAPGRSWRLGEAIVFHSHSDIELNFAEFYDLLSREQVISGRLIEAFEHLERTTTPLYSVLGQLHDADRELYRNRIWQKISRIMGPLLTDNSEDPASQLEVIRHCYVTTPLGEQTDDSLDVLIRDTPQGYLTTANVIDLHPGAEGKTAFSHRIESDVKAARPGAYILTGGVGSGKTTFLKRFANIVAVDFVERYTVWIHIDFLPVGNVARGELDTAVRAYVYRKVRDEVTAKFESELVASGEQLRAIFDEELAEARLTRLFGVAVDSDDWRRITNEIVDGLFHDDARFAFAALRYLRKRGRRIVLVLDNTDQQGEDFQEAVFLLSQRLSADYDALCVVALREEKFFAAYRRGIFDAFGDRRFHIGSPHLKIVLRKRLEFGREKFAALAKREESDLTTEDMGRIDALLRSLIRSTTEKNANIVRMLASVSNGDMRHALDMFREFLSSGNTNVDKIIGIVNDQGGYSVPFHEFAKSAILGARRYYRSSVSHIVNVYKQSDALGASHLAACRVLARLASAEGAASPHGEGFVSAIDLLREYRTSFGYAEDLLAWVGELLGRGLVESEPPRIGGLEVADAVRITASGAYYWRYLVRSFAYLDLVFVDTPLADKGVVHRLAAMADLTDLTVRFERVRAFLDYLNKREIEELAISAARSGPFGESLIAGIKQQVEKEIRTISRKTRVADRYGE